MSNKPSSKRKEDDQDAHVKTSATNSRNISTVKHDGAALAIATKKTRRQGTGPIKTAGRNPVGD